MNSKANCHLPLSGVRGTGWGHAASAHPPPKGAGAAGSILHTVQFCLDATRKALCEDTPRFLEKGEIVLPSTGIPAHQG